MPHCSIGAASRCSSVHRRHCITKRSERASPAAAEEEAMPNVKPIPDGYSSVTPYIIVAGAAKAIEFYKSVFGATERMRLGGPDGKIGHAELEIGDSLIMLADEHPEMGARG